MSFMSYIHSFIQYIKVETMHIGSRTHSRRLDADSSRVERDALPDESERLVALRGTVIMSIMQPNKRYISERSGSVWYRTEHETRNGNAHLEELRRLVCAFCNGEESVLRNIDSDDVAVNVEVWVWRRTMPFSAAHSVQRTNSTGLVHMFEY